jgi:FixJ family two-component response regulator
VGDKILFVDDEASALDGYRRILWQEFSICTSLGGEEALAAIRFNGPFAVIISDMRMPGMNGSEFLAQARTKAPDSVRMLLTGQADLNSAIDAVNRGNIFRFLTKPCEKQVLVEAIRSGLERYHAVLAEKELVRKAQSIAESKTGWDAGDVHPIGNTDGPDGLPGPVKARSHLEPRLGSDPTCYVLLLKLTLLPTVEERYGEEAASRYLIDAIGFLVQSLRPGDHLFHWSRGVFMAVLDRRIPPAAIRMEISRKLNNSPEHLIEVNGRKTMIVISTTYDLLPAAQFSNFDQLVAGFHAMLIGKT